MLKLSSVCRVDPDTLTLDAFVGLVMKVDLLKMSQSDNPQVRNHLTIHALQRELEVQKQAGLPPPFAD